MSELFKIPPRFHCAFSEDRRYRYTLCVRLRVKSPSGICMFIGLNPSTADEQKLDPTMRRCIDFAKRWGFGHLIMTNLFAFRTAFPEEMKRSASPIGPDNDLWLLKIANVAGLIVAAWGKDGGHMGRDLEVRTMLHRAGAKLHILEATKDNFPKHPLARGVHRIPNSAMPKPWPFDGGNKGATA